MLWLLHPMIWAGVFVLLETPHKQTRISCQRLIEKSVFPEFLLTCPISQLQTHRQSHQRGFCLLQSDLLGLHLQIQSACHIWIHRILVQSLHLYMHVSQVRERPLGIASIDCCAGLVGWKTLQGEKKAVGIEMQACKDICHCGLLITQFLGDSVITWFQSVLTYWGLVCTAKDGVQTAYFRRGVCNTVTCRGKWGNWGQLYQTTWRSYHSLQTQTMWDWCSSLMTMQAASSLRWGVASG